MNSQELLRDLLVCPFCGSGVEVLPEQVRCLNSECGVVYPVRDGIPLMFAEEAVGKISDEKGTDDEQA
ncbi:MAG: Trm112 family protein [Verrucomicrobia bacterium]|nr:Trm112 family protein [Verrucomicrobiota bacterium]